MSVFIDDPDDFRVSVSAEIPPALPSGPQAAQVASIFGVSSAEPMTLYCDFRLDLQPGRIVAVVGPSGSGKSVLLRSAARQLSAVALDVETLGRSELSAVDLLAPGPLEGRLEILSRCGLADAWALVTPARRLSGGQLYRLALAAAVHRALRRRRPAVVVADEFAATLDRLTAELLCRQVRKLVSAYSGRLALLLATPRQDILAALSPDELIVKPLGLPPQRLAGESLSNALPRHPAAPLLIRPGTIADYHALSRFHYLAGPPAAHKRVYVAVAAPAEPHLALVEPALAGVLVVSPPVLHVRGRNLATDHRYALADRRLAMRRLNEEVECISRVVVHPVYRGCGLAVRLVRHALADRRTPLVESLAAMGAVHPFFERAGMRAYRVGRDEHAERLLSAARAVGLSPAQLCAVEPVRRLLAADTPRARFLAREVRIAMVRAISAKRRRRLADSLAELCRRTVRQYVYYLGPQEQLISESAE